MTAGAEHTPAKADPVAEATALDVTEHRDRSLQNAALSALIPGLGQFAQGRRATALVQFSTVVAYIAGSVGLGGGRAVLFALAWNLWSVIDAYRHDAE